MKLEVKNRNYAAQIVRLRNVVPLAGTDFLSTVEIHGYTAIVGRDTSEGGLSILFSAETQLSEDLCKHANLYRDNTKNANTEKKGYVEDNRRIKAIKMKGQISSALLLDLENLSYLGINVSELNEGDSFDTINGVEICKKYVNRGGRHLNGANAKTEKVKRFARIDDSGFPEHSDTDNYFRVMENRSSDPLRSRPCVVTQKLHGTSGRFGNVRVTRPLSLVERIAKYFGANVNEKEYDYIAGSHHVIRDAKVTNDGGGFYGSDIWNTVLTTIKERIPQGTIIYGEIVGWIGEKEIQKGYSYGLNKGEYELYVYRVVQINDEDMTVDYSWDGVKIFCERNGFKHVPELWHGIASDFNAKDFMNIKYLESVNAGKAEYLNEPVGLSKDSPCDEGVCVRFDGINPYILKAKSPVFLGHETKELDAEESEQAITEQS